MDENISSQQWQGSQPQKWHGGKIHLRVQDCIGADNQHTYVDEKERKHFEPQYSNSQQYLPGQRQFGGKGSFNTYEGPITQGRKHDKVTLSAKQPRPERLHLQSKISGHQEDIPYGIQTFQENNKTRGLHYGLDDEMAKKKRIRELDVMRNGLNVISLGDKQYRHPDYSTDFFKEGLLIPGQNITMKTKQKKKGAEIVLREVHSKHIPAKEQMRLNMLVVDQAAVDELDDWVEKVLKEANPNYLDPETFLEREELKQVGKQQDIKGKDVKKAGKK